MPSPRSALLLALVVGLALAVVAVQVVLQLWTQPVPHSAWRLGLSAVALTGAWWLLDGPLEGPVLLTLSSEHGLTLADLLGGLALLLGAALLTRSLPA